MEKVIVFTNKETAEKFEALTSWDQWVHVPARVGDGQCYNGNVSDIDAEAAERYVRFGGNLMQKKIVATKASTKPEPTK